MKDRTLATAPYAEQMKRWPQAGRHVLVQFDDETIIVYQAYRPEIGNFAVEKGYFGGEFKYSRMSWIKPNFLWMMYRSQWGQFEGQEVVLALRIKRKFFDSLLSQAVPSHRSSPIGTNGWQRLRSRTCGCNGTQTTRRTARSASVGPFSLGCEE